MITPSLHPRYIAGVASQSYPIRSAHSRKFKGYPLSAVIMHWARKVGIGMCFIFMPAVAPLWAIAFDVEVESMIRMLTILFVPGLLLALGGRSVEQEDLV